MPVARFFLRDDRIRENCIRAIRQAPIGQMVEIKEPKRSLDQNARLHAMIGEVASTVVWYGAKRSPHAWKRIFAAALFDHELVPGIEPGSLVLVEKKTSEMGVREMNDLMALIEEFGARHNVIFHERERERA